MVKKIVTKLFFILLFFALVAYGQQTSVAVLPSDGSVLSNDELEVLTDKMREAALKVLPTKDFVLVKQDVVVKRLGGAENYIKECQESTCIVNLGKKAMVDYVAQASVGELGNGIRLKVELYDVRTEGLVSIVNDEAEDLRGLLAIVKNRVPDEMFGKIPGTSGYTQTKETEKFAEDYKALETERRKQEKMNNSWETEQKLRKAEKQDMIGYQNLYEMPFGLRMSTGSLYFTFNFRLTDFKEWSEEDLYDTHFYLSNPDRIFKWGGDEYRHSGGYTDDAFEWIVGYIWRPFYWLGVFGGCGFRHTDEYRRYDIYYISYNGESYRDTKWVSANELRHDFKYELGLEFVVFETLAAYISVRNFSYTGGGIGLVF